MDFGRAWARAAVGVGQGPDELDSDLELAGAPKDVRESMAARDAASDEVEVLWENRRAVELFLACSTQWRVGAMGGYIGLDYAGVRAAREEMGFKNSRDIFWRLRVIEGAALGVLNEKPRGRLQDKHQDHR